MGSFLFILAIGAVVSAIRFAWRYDSLQEVVRRQLVGAPLQTTADFPENTVGTVQGTLRYLGDAPLVAPLTGRPCACYDVIIEQPGGGYRESASRLVLSASADMPLYVSDDISALR